MRILTEEFVAGWEGRMVNSPSLAAAPVQGAAHGMSGPLPQAIRIGGCSVHLVTAELVKNAGPVLGQIPVAILPGDNAATLAARVLIAEHQLYARCLAALVSQDRDPGMAAA